MTPYVQQRVGIVVAAYNAESYLAESLRSVIAQTFDRWECVIVDDGSTDGTASVARAFSDADGRFRLVEQTNQGTPTARNNGLAVLADAVTSVAFLDADDTWLPDALETLTAALDDHAEAVGVYGLAEYLDSEGRPLAPGRHPAGQRARRRMGRFDLVDLPTADPYTFESLIISGTMWPTAIGLHRRAAVDRVGGFDPHLRQVQDWDLYLRMSRSGPFVPVDHQVAWYRQHATNVTHRSDRVAFYSLQVRRKAFDSGEDTHAQHVLSRRVWRRLVFRWTVWTAEAGLRHLRRWQLGSAAAALLAVVRFLPTLIVGRPSRPERQLASTIARYVSGRAFNPRIPPSPESAPAGPPAGGPGG